MSGDVRLTARRCSGCGRVRDRGRDRSTGRRSQRSFSQRHRSDRLADFGTSLQRCRRKHCSCCSRCCQHSDGQSDQLLSDAVAAANAVAACTIAAAAAAASVTRFTGAGGPSLTQADMMPSTECCCFIGRRDNARRSHAMIYLCVEKMNECNRSKPTNERDPSI